MSAMVKRSVQEVHKLTDAQVQVLRDIVEGLIFRVPSGPQMGRYRRREKALPGSPSRLLPGPTMRRLEQWDVPLWELDAYSGKRGSNEWQIRLSAAGEFLLRKIDDKPDPEPEPLPSRLDVVTDGTMQGERCDCGCPWIGCPTCGGPRCLHCWPLCGSFADCHDG